MTAFILSAGLSFAIYELLALWHIPDTRRGDDPTKQSVLGVDLVFEPLALRRFKIFGRVLIVIAALAALLLIHQEVMPLESIAGHSANIYLGFLFGPLLAIWVNVVIFHPPHYELTRGQAVAGIGLVLLFLLGSVGDETANLLGRYANHLSGLKLAGAELTFAEPTHKYDIGSTAPAGSGYSDTSGSSGLLYLTQLGGKHSIIGRDLEYLKLFKPALDDTQADKLSKAEKFATDLITPPLGCLLAWSQQTGDIGPVDQHLKAFADGFRQVATLKSDDKTQTTPDPGRLKDISTGFIRSGLAMAYDVMASTVSPKVINACGPWMWKFCSESLIRDDKGTPTNIEDDTFTWDDKGTPTKIYDDTFTIVDRPQLLQCLREQSKALDQPSPPTKPGETAPSNPARDSAADLSGDLQAFVEQDGLSERPYFAIGYAGIMAQLGYYPAAASIIDDWLRQQPKPTSNEHDEFLVQNWFTVRARMFQAAYMEEWLVREDRKALTSLQDEHLTNLTALRDGLRDRLRNADFFKPLDQPCDNNCPIVLKAPAACKSDALPKDLQLWQKLFTSYVSIETTYIERAVHHPEYKTRFLEMTNLEARRLANFDLSCSADSPDAWYAAVLAAFAQSAVNLTRALGDNDSREARDKRLEEADRAARFGLEVVHDTAHADRESDDKRFLDRIQPSVAVQAQDELRSLRNEIAQIKNELE